MTCRPAVVGPTPLLSNSERRGKVDRDRHAAGTYSGSLRDHPRTSTKSATLHRWVQQRLGQTGPRPTYRSRHSITCVRTQHAATRLPGQMLARLDRQGASRDRRGLQLANQRRSGGTILVPHPYDTAIVLREGCTATNRAVASRCSSALARGIKRITGANSLHPTGENGALPVSES